MPFRTEPDRRPTRTGPYHFGPVRGPKFWTNSVSVWFDLGRSGSVFDRCSPLPVCTTISQSSQTFTSSLLHTTPTPPPTIETTNIPSTILDFASVFRFNERVIALEQDVAELKKDPLHTQVTALVDDHLDTRMGATREEFMNFLSASLTDRITEQVRNQLPQILLEEMSNFAPPVIEKMIEESLNQVNLAKASSQPQSTFEAAATLTEFELKKILIDKMNTSESYLTALERRECYDGLIKSYNLDKDFFSSYDTVQSEEPEFEVGDSDTRQGQEGNLEKLDWENPEGSDYPFDLSKPLSLITRGKRQRVPVEFFINNYLKYLQGGISTMTYTTSTTKTKAAHYDLPGIEDMVPNIWSPVKVAYDKYALWGISHWREQCKYGYLEEIVVRRSDNVLYKFKEGDDVADFVIALRMFTKSLVIQKRVEYLQLGVESYQKQINVTKLQDHISEKDTLTLHTKPLRIHLCRRLQEEHVDALRRTVQRRWSTLEKKRSHFMIKDINKLLKERRMMRSLEKFVGGRLYGTDLTLLQRTI
nr:hypothetical protein [Tanacetum cinerariifolium]